MASQLLRRVDFSFFFFLIGSGSDRPSFSLEQLSVEVCYIRDVDHRRFPIEKETLSAESGYNETCEIDDSCTAQLKNAARSCHLFFFLLLHIGWVSIRINWFGGTQLFERNIPDWWQCCIDMPRSRDLMNICSFRWEESVVLNYSCCGSYKIGNPPSDLSTPT